MVTEITVPKLGLTMEQAVMVSWAFKQGDRVAEKEPVLVMETDKVTYEMPSPGSGLLYPVVAPGETITPGQVIGYLASDETELKKLAAQHPAAVPGDVKPVEAWAGAAAPEPAPASAAPGGRLKASPVARAMAREHGIDLSILSGSGPGGRIVRADVLNALEKGIPAPPPPAPRAPSIPEDDLSLTPAREIAISGIRKVIFNNMHASLQSQAQLTLQTEASAEGIIRLRRELNRRYEEEGIKISYNAVIVKAAAQALKAHPGINVSTDGKTIRVWREIHIGVAIDPGEGLVVPKVRRPDAKGIREISQALDAIVEKAKGKKLTVDELTGGTFTVTNLGAWEIDGFTPIVNPPESAILGIGRIVEKPVVKDGGIVAEHRLALSLTIDHRVIDGAPGAAFLKTIKDYLENPILMLE